MPIFATENTENTENTEEDEIGSVPA